MKVLLGASSILSANLTQIKPSPQHSAIASQDPKIAAASGFLTSCTDEYEGLMDHEDSLECEALLECKDDSSPVPDALNSTELPPVAEILVPKHNAEPQIYRLSNQHAHNAVSNTPEVNHMSFLLSVISVLTTTLKSMKDSFQSILMPAQKPCACDSARTLNPSDWPELPSMVPLRSKQDFQIQERKALEKDARRNTAYELFKKNKNKDKHAQQPARSNISHRSLQPATSKKVSHRSMK